MNDGCAMTMMADGSQVSPQHAVPVLCPPPILTECYGVLNSPRKSSWTQHL